MNQEQLERENSAKAHMRDRIAKSPVVYKNMCEIHIDGQLIGEFRVKSKIWREAMNMVKDKETFNRMYDEGYRKGYLK